MTEHLVSFVTHHFLILTNHYCPSDGPTTIGKDTPARAAQIAKFTHKSMELEYSRGRPHAIKRHYSMQATALRDRLRSHSALQCDHAVINFYQCKAHNENCAQIGSESLRVSSMA